ncbi:MucR family transcriptional regulator [Mesorhizobium sp. ASY16-5R]|uniref:MucR family transcriptional regulator n=1 Tax=Mesorhizobium sp. ASY16-5R TaxID=3445772 RepID=UPI003FA0CCC6
MTDKHQLIELTAEIVAAYVSKNSVPAAGLPSLITGLYSKLEAVSQLGRPEPEVGEPLKPCVNPKKSVHPDYIVCLEDGLKFASLKRHLTTSHGLTPEAYRKKWGLAPDYPMVAPKYSARRSELAKDIGLGRASVPAIEKRRPAKK